MTYGTLNSDVIQSSTAGTPPQFNDGSSTQIGTLCRAWADWNGVSSVTIRASFNVSSITRTGTGSYTINFTNAMPDANYCVVTSANPNNSGRSAALSTYTSVTTTSFNTICNDTGNATVDASYANIAVFR